MNDTNEQKNSPMPDFYVPPLSTPLRWQDEQTGTLPNAVKAYFAHSLDNKKPFYWNAMCIGAGLPALLH